MSALRIAIDYRPALLGRSGIPRAVRELARALAARNDLDLRLFAHSLAAAKVPATLAGTRLHRLPIPGRTLTALARLGIDGGALAGGASVFHWTDYVHPPVAARRRVVLTLHDCAFAADSAFHGGDTQVLAERTRAAAARADLVVCPTRATARDAETRLMVPAARLRVVPFGADHLRPPPHPPNADGPIVMVGTIEPRKNHVRALAAWRALGAARPELIVIGAPGWCCDEAVRELRAAERENGLSWLRDADDRTLHQLLSRAAVVLYPSHFEGFGFPTLEALAFGTPVVAGNTPALREVLGEHAEWCDPTDVESITEALRRALSSHTGSADSAAARRAHAAGYRWADCAASHAAIYAEVIS